MKISSEDRIFLEMAIEEARTNINNGGGPFGAVVVRGGKVISSSGNRVVPENDPTAHAEIQAIRKAASALGTFDLADCVIFSSCEPCPMCLGAIYWSGIKRVVFSADRYMAAEAGFSDEMIYSELSLPADRRSIEMNQALRAEGAEVFSDWEKYPGKVPY